ncbi:hypothetical protein [Denitrobaculum tricleocarpae]|uniref:Uncharacterized protein n=1 Tax=Denitrobaculum tricleocarpae TaxID=2591009 RepID=A0A545TU74_9PROT|nr:hypothetical protein [Denitrobaculum tricleocarpae]TQV80766.1 hypothetical protein FKG95_11485 [Denitrobaculum tricleocarpae]
MNQADAHEIAAAAAEEAVERTFVRMGLDTRDPREAQADMAYLRTQRKASERVGLALRVAVYTTAITGLLSMLWIGFKQAFSNGS